MNYFIHNKKYFYIKIHYWILAGVLFVSTGLYATQYSEKTLDSLKALLNKPNISENDLFFVYKKLTNAYLQSDTKKSLEYAWMGVRFGEKKNSPYLIAEFYYNVGNTYYYANNSDSALNYFAKSSDILKQANTNSAGDKEKSDFLQQRLYRSMGVINDARGQYDLAVDNYYKAIAIAERINEPDEIIAAYTNLAATFTRMSNYQQAEVYYLKGEKLSKEQNDSIGLATIYTGLCCVLKNKKDYPGALKYGEESDKILSALIDAPVYLLMSANMQLTDVWLKIPDYGKAMEFARKTVEYAKQTGVPAYLASALHTLSTCYLKQERYKDAEETAFLALATDSTDISTNSFLYDNIAQANIWMGNPKKGIEYSEKTLNAYRAYSNKNFQTSLSEMEVKYETEKKELKIADLEKKRKLMVLLGIAGGAVLLSVLTTFFLLWRRTVLKRKLAETRIKQLEQEKQLVATQAVLDGETRERARLARDLHDGLGSMLTGAKLSLLEMKKGAKLEYNDVERFDKALGLLDDSVVEMRRVAHHLMPDSLSRFGLKTALSDFCDNYPIISFTYYGDESRSDPRLEVMIYRSIHELVNNALKYAGASRILVQIMQESDRIAFTVQDDGCGFDASKETKGTGLGNIRNRIASFGGNIQIDSKAGEGTEINGELRIRN